MESAPLVADFIHARELGMHECSLWDASVSFGLCFQAILTIYEESAIMLTTNTAEMPTIGDCK